MPAHEKQPNSASRAHRRRVLRRALHIVRHAERVEFALCAFAGRPRDAKTHAEIAEACSAVAEELGEMIACTP